MTMNEEKLVHVQIIKERVKFFVIIFGVLAILVVIGFIWWDLNKKRILGKYIPFYDDAQDRQVGNPKKDNSIRY